MFNVSTSITTQSSDNTNSSGNTTQRYSQFHEQKLIEKYYRDTELFGLIEEAVAKFTNNYTETRKPEEALAPILIRLDFDYTDLVKHGQQLLHFIYREPLQFDEAVKYSVYGLVRDLLKANSNNGPKAIDIAQLHTQWRLLDIPLQKCLIFCPTKYNCPLGISLVHGILSAYTPPEILVLQSIWYCSGNCKRNAIRSNSTEGKCFANLWIDTLLNFLGFSCSAFVSQLFTVHERISKVACD
ncbi:uncharacterized protein LOC117569419 [Drosophila albomicans]|uniref:Uncharacterized protein LOC117569419 n=1 Tax=Drosophila albomicans TaxID=7291 RepID=A0A9C6W568_DROAB|nr:uncharacterized protein LOC117569419 [Drosophila albomicans]